jgi:hypothetical protein
MQCGYRWGDRDCFFDRIAGAWFGFNSSPVSSRYGVSSGYSLEVDPDSVVAYYHTIRNTGDQAAFFSVQADASEGWLLDYFNDTYPGGTTIIMPFPLQVGEVTTVGVRLTVPAGVSGGTVNTTAVTVTLLSAGEPYTRAVVYDLAVVKMRYVYLPMVLREYDPFSNGDFSDGLESWSKLGTLGVSMALDPSNSSNPVALLGNPAYACWEGVPLGSAGILQSFTVPPAPGGKSVHLRFRYRIFTNDLNEGLTDNYDTFDVFVNGIRRFRDANEDRDKFDNYCYVAPYDLQWRVGEIDLGAGGERFTLSLEVHNRFDQFYNTYVYVDDVQLVIVD